MDLGATPQTEEPYSREGRICAVYVVGRNSTLDIHMKIVKVLMCKKFSHSPSCLHLELPLRAFGPKLLEPLILSQGHG